MPPTNASRSSITIVFSWWQCSGRSFASRAQSIRVFLVSCSRICFTSRREGRKSGRGAPAHTSTRTSIRSASRASRLRRTVGSPSRASAKSGEKNQPVRWTCERASSSAAAIRGSASSAVDQEFERIALPHRSRCGPTASGRLERVFPADPSQAPPVMSTHLHRQLIARPPVDDSPAASRQRQPGQRLIVAATNTHAPRRDPQSWRRPSPTIHRCCLIGSRRHSSYTFSMGRSGETVQKEQTQETHLLTIPPTLPPKTPIAAGRRGGADRTLGRIARSSLSPVPGRGQLGRLPRRGLCRVP